VHLKERRIRAHCSTPRSGSCSRRAAAPAQGLLREWDEPQISASLVSELISIAGGDDIFPQRAAATSVAIASSPTDEVVACAPDTSSVHGAAEISRRKGGVRSGWSAVPAVRDGNCMK